MGERSKNRKKPPKIELMPIKLPSLRSQYLSAYVMVWRNHDENHFHAPYPGQESVSDFLKFYNDPDIIFNSELPDLYNNLV